MSSTRAQRLVALFDRAADLDPRAQAELLARECADDEALRHEVERLLAADRGDTARVLESATIPATGPLPRAGDVVGGRYRIVRQVGEGGMGVVFEAEQSEPRRRVALKCIRPGLLDQAALQRFRREAAALGRLQHPGIAQVFEAGVHDGTPALPFLAMEFVDGQPLGEAAAGLPLRDRIELLAAVAEAVAHAHERGVVHRDLKPGNVLVELGSSGPRPRVVDFGVARLHGDDAATAYTRTHQLVGTLAYISPEQVQHGSASADARSDVWSLGVTAFEVLAGASPLPLREASLAEAARVLRDEEPTRLDRLVPALRGDVATIVHKALEKDPARRYPDAGAFAADLRRHLADQPIAARPASAFYQATRFARRHRGLVVGLAVAFVALVAGLLVTIGFASRVAGERDRANARTGELRAMLRTLLGDVDRELAGVPGALEARRTLMRAGLQHAEGMARDALQSGDEPGLLVEVANLFLVLANVQGRPGSANLGDSAGALQNLVRAHELVDRAIAAAPRASEPSRARLRVFATQDSLLRALGRTEEREAVLVAQQREAERLRAFAPGDAAEREVAVARANHARWLADRGRYAEAIPGMVAMRDFLRAQLARGGGDGDAVRDDESSARALDLHLAGLHERLGDFAAAGEAFAAVVTFSQSLHERHRDDASARGFAGALRDDGIFHMRRKQYAVAAERLQRARELMAPVAAANPADLDAQRQLRTTELVLADALLKTTDGAQGRELLRDCIAALEALVAANPDNLLLRRDLVPCRHTAANAAVRAADFATAAAEGQAALQEARALREKQPRSAQFADDELMSLAVLANAAEAAAGAADLDAATRASRRAAAVAALEAQLECARRLADEELLPPTRRALFDELPKRAAALRDGG